MTAKVLWKKRANCSRIVHGDSNRGLATAIICSLGSSQADAARAADFDAAAAHLVYPNGASDEMNRSRLHCGD
jgi:hypothetical protein